MRRVSYAWLVLRAFAQLLRYDCETALWGFGCIQRRLARHQPSRESNDETLVPAVCDAVVLAACFYWKPVLCLQRSVCAVRLLRARGVAARLVIGYRPVPFFSHAWVEVNGRVVNDSPAYRQRLQVLYTA